MAPTCDEGIRGEEEKLAIRAGDPISIVVSDVYLPRDFSGTRDVVVLLDVYASSQRQTESYAVWYQRGVRGGQKLGFDSLLVYSDQQNAVGRTPSILPHQGVLLPANRRLQPRSFINRQSRRSMPA